MKDRDQQLIFETYIQSLAEADVDPDELADMLSRGHGKRGQRVSRTRPVYTGSVPQTGSQGTTGVKVTGKRSKEDIEAGEKDEAYRQEMLKQQRKEQEMERFEDPNISPGLFGTPYNPVAARETLRHLRTRPLGRMEKQEERDKRIAEAEKEFEPGGRYGAPIPSEPGSRVKLIKSREPKPASDITTVSQDELMAKMAQIKDELERRERQEEDESLSGYVNQSYQHNTDLTLI
jgi:hypothetical protein